VPFTVIGLPGGMVRVENAATGRVAAKCTTPARARAQLRVLHAVDQRAGHGLCSCPCLCWQGGDGDGGWCLDCRGGRHSGSR